MTCLAELQELGSSQQSNVLDLLPRKDLQALAKECGVKANAKSRDIISSILEYLSETDGHSHQSAAAAEDGSKQGQQSSGDEGPASPALGIRVSPQQALGLPKKSSISVQPEAAPSHMNPSCQPAAGSSSSPEAVRAAAQQVGPGSPPGGTAAADVQAEEPAPGPDAVMECGVEQDDAAASPAVTVAEGVAAEGSLPRGEEDEPMLGPEACEPEAAGEEWKAPSEACSSGSMGTDAAAAAAGEADRAFQQFQEEGGISNPLFRGASGSLDGRRPSAVATAHSLRTSLLQRQASQRELTPEELGLDKAVELAQAGSSELSPSLLTMMQQASGSLEGSPSAQDAFQRGRRSGMWQGATEVQLRQLERQWDSYKTATQRHWDLPSLSDVEAKSTALAASGFTTVDSPLVGSMQALGMQSAPAQASHGKRKQRSQEAGEEQGVGGQPRKAAKRGAGQAPSQMQKHAKYTSPGKALRGPSRLCSSSGVAGKENEHVALEPVPATLIPCGPACTSPRTGLPPRPKEAAAGTKSKIPVKKPLDRAKMAEESFAARRTAAISRKLK